MAEDAGKQQIQIKVRGQDGSDTTFKVKKETRFDKIITAYANQKGIAANSFRLMFDGKRINANDTPKMLELEEDDVVDCIMEQIGGGAEGDDASKQQITIKVRDSEGNEVSFKVKRETKFSKIMSAYAEQKGVETSSFNLLFDGERIKGEHTPKMLEMEEGDLVQAVNHQTGGVAVLC